ncbi:hypothetical protein [Glycomyces paridis]|uniref:HNH endonuclease n=1 Tax=Glycomyces paridis TaxID=2126555 RepID=A0A4S8PC69_9ACTN|nr:hypothetical protein [Glycomyces paridis]THV27918.1 hypothetical protein E9998_13075 [Glycomyces paridis]
MSAPKPTRRVPAALAYAIRDRDDSRCVGCGDRVDGDLYQTWAIGRRIPSAPRGTPATDPRIVLPSNLILLCGYNAGCHRAIVAHPNEARARGLRLWRSQNPLTVPVLAWTGAARGAVTLASHVTPFYVDNAGIRAVVDRRPNPLATAGRRA